MLTPFDGMFFAQKPDEVQLVKRFLRVLGVVYVFFG